MIPRQQIIRIADRDGVSAPTVERDYVLSHVVAQNAGHIGTLGCHGRLAARAGCVAIITSSTSLAAVVPGGSVRLLGTNPLCFAMPLGREELVADFSTTTMSRGQLLASVESSEALPQRQAVDALGNFTRDPRLALEGGLLPYGAKIKGALISLLLSTLAGPLIGAPTNDRVTGTRATEEPPRKGDFFCCLNISSFTNRVRFETEMASFLGSLSRSSNAFRIPGVTPRATLSQRIAISKQLESVLSAELDVGPTAMPTPQYATSE